MDGLMDLGYGAWQMRTQDEVKAEAPDAFRLWHSAPYLVRFPGGESLQDLVARTSGAWCWRGIRADSRDGGA